MKSSRPTLPEIQSECRHLEVAVLRLGLATPEEAKQYQPGGEQNPTKDFRGWWKYLIRLNRWHARGEGAQAPGDTSKDGEVLKALKGDPVPVRLSLGRSMLVYPKSMEALMLCHALDIQLGWMTAQKAELESRATAAAVDALPALLDAIAYTYHLLVWIVTTEGPGAPFAAHDEHPEPPQAVRELEPWDVVVVLNAHHQHMIRLHALSLLLDDKKVGKKDGKRPSWSVFFGSLEAELGASVEHLMKYRSLVSLLATVRINNYVRTPDATD